MTRQNRVLGLTAKSIPYVKELRPYAGSVTSSILWQQIEYWFMNNNYQPFYKFSQPCEHDLYRKGDSWTEELGFSIDEFRSAFDNIGIRYQSVNAFQKVLHENNQDLRMAFIIKQGEKVSEKMYISVYDRIKKTTTYYRNDELINSTLDNIFNPKTDTTPQPPLLRNEDIPIYVNGESQFTVNGECQSGIYTENTITENNTDIDFNFFYPLNYICKNFIQAREEILKLPDEVKKLCYPEIKEHMIVVDLSFLGINKRLQIVSYDKLTKVPLEHFSWLKSHYNASKVVSHISDPKIGGWEYHQIVNELYTDMVALINKNNSQPEIRKSHNEIMEWLNKHQ